MRRGISVEAVVANLTRQSHLVEENGVRVQKLGSWGTISRKPFTPTLPLQLRRKDVDLIHIHLANPMATISALLARPSAPIVVTYHMDIVKQRRFLTFFRPFLHRFLDRVERIIATLASLH
ncbi:MAG: hypothetical protein KatS3mg115_0597 [Candidatus Poribacteria bacterium]|nr:MAG: hypothetical protein KatS3mg115_0597 [Candidatus Poribacteria bacterium]